MAVEGVDERSSHLESDGSAAATAGEGKVRIGHRCVARSGYGSLAPDALAGTHVSDEPVTRLRLVGEQVPAVCDVLDGHRGRGAQRSRRPNASAASASTAADHATAHGQIAALTLLAPPNGPSWTITPVAPRMSAVSAWRPFW